MPKKLGIQARGAFERGGGDDRNFQPFRKRRETGAIERA
jgi:hypothetical protein